MIRGHARAPGAVEPSLGGPLMVTLAHPVSGHPHVDVSLILVAAPVAVALALVLVAVPDPPPRPGLPADDTVGWQAPSSTPATGLAAVIRGAVLALVLLAVVAGRTGVDDELENVAPALVVGVGWPALVLLALAGGPVWHRIDPWDTLARILRAGSRARPPGHVWPAVVLAVPLLWFLSVHPTPLDPRGIGLVLGAYSTLTVAGCLLLGRRRWLASGEPVGLFLTGVGLASRGRLTAVPPRGTEALVGVVAAGLLFGALRRTALWEPVAGSQHPGRWTSAAFLGACLLGATVLTLGGRSRRDPGLREAVLSAALVVTAGIALAVALARNRLFTSLQILPAVLVDPFGVGWDLLGPPTVGLCPAPLGAAGLVAVQLGLVVVTALWGAATAAARTRRTSRPQLAATLLPLVVLATLLVAAH